MASKLGQKAVRILRGPIVQQIHFIYPSYGGGFSRVTPTQFLKVALAIELGQIEVRYDKTIPEWAAASYNMAQDRVKLSALDTVHDQAAFVHECFHASHDLNKSTTIGLDEEAAGFVVYALYIALYAASIPDEVLSSAMSAAREVALIITSGKATKFDGVPHVNLTHWQHLQANLLMTPAYVFPFQSIPGYEWEIGELAQLQPYPRDGLKRRPKRRRSRAR